MARYLLLKAWGGVYADFDVCVPEQTRFLYV
jgi:mannosyltransferase OCH1-like enzyme